MNFSLSKPDLKETCMSGFKPMNTSIDANQKLGMTMGIWTLLNV